MSTVRSLAGPNRCVYRPGNPPEVRHAIRRLMRVAGGPVYPPPGWYGSVAYWDARTSGNDARAALSLAAGAPVDDVHPVTGTWSRPVVPAQLALDVAA